MRFAVAALLVCPMLVATEHSGRRAPGFALPDLNINYHDLYDYRGKIVLLDFMQTACPVCGTSQRIFESIRLKYPDKVTVLGIVNPPDTQNTVRQFIANFAMKTPILFDCGQVTASYFKLKPERPQVSLPHVFIIDATGTIRSDYEYKQGFEKYFESLEPLMTEVTALVNEMSKGAADPKPAPPKAPAPKPAGKK